MITGFTWGCGELSTGHMPDAGGGNVVESSQSHHRHILLFRMLSESRVRTNQYAQIDSRTQVWSATHTPVRVM